MGAEISTNQTGGDGQCSCIKSDGKQCTRNASKKDGHNQSFCWQHQKCTNIKSHEPVTQMTQVTPVTPVTPDEPVEEPVVPVVNHVFSNLITLNGYGSKLSKKIVVPDGIQVLIPNQRGTDDTYTTPFSKGGWYSKLDNPNILTNGEGFEKPLYEGGYLNYLGVSPTGSGIEDPKNKRGIPWKLYVAGDTIDNMRYSPFKSGPDACSVGVNYRTKIPLQREMIDQSNTHLANISFSVTLVPKHKNNDRDGKYTSEKSGLVKFQGKYKPIIKTCPRGKSSFTLEDIFDNLVGFVDKLPENIKKCITPFDKPIDNNNPLILIPFTCNDSTPPNPSNNFDGDNQTPLNDYYQILLELSKK
jgi:hypothetical protein